MVSYEATTTGTLAHKLKTSYNNYTINATTTVTAATVPVRNNRIRVFGYILLYTTETRKQLL